MRFIHKNQESLEPARAVQLFAENRYCAPALKLHAFCLVIFLDWVMLPHLQATSSDYGGPPHFGLRGGDVTNSPPLSVLGKI